jgi:ATP-binding cassette subfamily B protein/subfamily B ATP-binding cassette protein MsbA
MRNFGRALRDALRFWPSLVLATLCSIAMATLWGANIGACYPILEVALRGESISSWLEGEQKAAQRRIEEIQGKLQDLPVVDDLSPAERARIQNKRALLEQQVVNEQNAIQRTVRIKPWVDRWVPRDPFHTIACIVAVLIGSTLIKHVFMLINEVLVARVAVDISRGIRQKIFQQALDMDRAKFAKYGTSGFSAHITSTSEMLSNGLMNTLGGAVREPLKILSCLIGAGLICWRLLFLSMIVAPLVFGLLWWVTRRLKSISQGALNRVAGFHQVMLESLGNVQTTQAYSMENYESNRFAQSMWEMRMLNLKFILYTTLAKPVIELLGLGMLGTAIVGGAYLVLNQETHLLGIRICNQPLSVSALLIFFGMLIGASDPLRKLSAVYSSIYAGTIAADVLYPLLDYRSTICNPEHPRVPPSPHQMLKLSDVSFGYTPEQKLLDSVSLEIPFGSTAAIIGHNGSGKSTLINLLCRFYDPVQGSLTLDGVDLREMTIENLRKRIAMVTQHSELFNNSVAYNIRYGSPDATDEEVEQASREAHAHEFITTVLEKGYDTFVGQNGQRLSGGQRQRIALARALLRNPEILILDECTSQIDMRSEQLIRESLAAHRGRHTMIIITHREALLELADVVYEVADGGLKLVSSMAVTSGNGKKDQPKAA